LKRQKTPLPVDAFPGHPLATGERSVKGVFVFAQTAICKQCLHVGEGSNVGVKKKEAMIMATRKQSGVIGRGPVVSVRLEHELVERLDALAERTGRSRGTYLRMALWAMIPTLERMHWEQVAKDFESLAIKDAFEEITLGLMEDAINADRYREEPPGSDESGTRTP
jgi:RHH-type rel operon transcriptional repressor/antitoxin RelB